LIVFVRGLAKNAEKMLIARYASAIFRRTRPRPTETLGMGLPSRCLDDLFQKYVVFPSVAKVVFVIGAAARFVQVGQDLYLPTWHTPVGIFLVWNADLKGFPT